MLRREEEFELDARRAEERVEGTVRVASIYSVGMSEMSRLRRGVRARASRTPNCTVEYLRPDKVYEAVLAEDADLGLVSYPEPAAELAVDSRGGEEEMAVAARPGHPLAATKRRCARPTWTGRTSSPSTTTCRSAASWTASCASRASR